MIAILGIKGATLPAEVEIPANTRVADFLSYDALLEYADVWVLNAGYGGALHGIVNGVPMVLGGDTEDKPEIAMRGEWTGVAHNLKTGKPTPEQVARGVADVLSDDKYKKRVVELQKENEEMKSLDTVEKYKSGTKLPLSLGSNLWGSESDSCRHLGGEAGVREVLCGVRNVPRRRQGEQQRRRRPYPEEIQVIRRLRCHD